jgi:hypothetical protein
MAVWVHQRGVVIMPSQTLNLTYKHQELEEKIKEEMKRPLPDEAILFTLKRQKLRIKDALISKA